MIILISDIIHLFGGFVCANGSRYSKCDFTCQHFFSVSLEVLSDGTTPIPPNESRDDGLPKLYIHQHAFMKVLGATIDIEEDGFTPFLLDREGNVMDPNNS